MTVSNTLPLHYRPDLDGLRALAILPVVLYHYGLAGLTGGFVGVDIFFVISGFLITSLLLRDLDDRTFSLIGFYERRARRILPALFFMLATTTVLSVFVLLPRDLSHYGKSLTATTAFASNLFFWREFGYFDRAAELKPLLHTWSLAVEEQFYILFPPLLWLIARFARRHLIVILVAGLCSSFFLSVIGTSLWPVAAFYLPATRAWELLIGALLAAGALPRLTNTRLRTTLSIVGLGFIVGSVILIERSIAFPGWQAMFPCVGAGLIIHASVSGGAIGNRVLQWRPLVAVGLVSYSLYLWHWPLLVLARYTANRELAPPEIVAVLVAACGLSFVSWRYIERPFRSSLSAFDRVRVFRLAGLASGVAVICGAAFVVGGGFPSRLPADVLKYANVSSEQVHAQPGCFDRRAEDVRAGRLCTIGAETGVTPSFIVWGDSHAYRAAMPIAEIARVRDRMGWLASVGFCPPLLDVEWPVAGCHSFNDEVMTLIEREKIDLVILSGVWAYYAEGNGFNRELGEGVGNVLSDDISVRKTVGENGAVFARALRHTVERLSRKGAHVVILGPVPEIAFPVPETLARAQWFGGTKDIGPSEAEFDFRQRHVFTALAAASFHNTETLYPSKVLCEGVCDVERLGKVLYIDDNHLSRAGLDLMKPLLEGVFD